MRGSLAEPAHRCGESFLLLGILVLASVGLPVAVAGDHRSRVEQVIEGEGSGSFHCAWHREPVKGYCRVSHEHVLTHDPELVAFYGDGKPTATLDAVVIRWPSGKITRLVETGSLEWYVLGSPLQGNYHSAQKPDVMDVDWWRGFVILDDRWVETFRVW